MRHVPGQSDDGTGHVATAAGCLMAGVGGAIPMGIGATVLVFLWAAPFDQFGSPPLFFRIFGSFIGLGFIGFGLLFALTALTGANRFKRHLGERHRFADAQSTLEPPEPSQPPATPESQPGYRCRHCGAPLSEDAEVSPMGDVKCTFCGSWFNIHGRGR